MSNLTDLLSNTPGGLVSNIAGKLIDTIASFFPNPEKKAEAAQAIVTAQLNGAFKEEEYQFQLMLEQIKTNQVEAASTNWFVAGWRPYIGWVCGTGLAYQFLLMPIGNGIAASFGHIGIFLTLNTDTLLSCLSGLLGLGAMRSFEKFKGVESSR
jgi:hypothetical protein